MPKARPTSQLIIAGKPVQVTHEAVALTSLRLDPDNPRIRLQRAVAGRKKSPTPEELLDLMRAQPGFDELQRQIREQGGIYDPLIVRHDGRIVEGNTRFTVLSVLTKTPGGIKKWGTVPIVRLPADVPEKAIQLQMAGYHISGKNRWRAAAQADQIHRLIDENKASMEEVAVATRMTPKQVQQNIDAYKYLVEEVIPELKDATTADKQEILDTKFSHALELMTRRDLESVRQDKDARKKVAKVIAEGKIKGAQVRKLHTVLKNSRARDALERHGFDAAKEVLRKADPTGDSKVLKSVEKLTEVLATLDRNDLELFSAHANAREALQALVAAADNVLSMTMPKGKRRA
jgi:hypothetical protein